MKLREIALFCSIFFGIAFAQDSSSVAIDSAAASYIATEPVVADSAAIDSAAIDSTAIDLPAADSVKTDSAKADSAATDSAAADSVKKEIKKGLHFFIGAGAHFIDFKERLKFQALLEAQFAAYENDYKEDTTGYLPPQKQNFQNVNLTFPISAGLTWHFGDMHSLGLGAAFLYNNESVVLTDKDGKTHNLKYTLQAVPVFAEYRLQISPDFISLKNGDYFSLFLRYYWLFPPTEFSSSWGSAKADFEASGSGYGFFMGYRFWEWESFSFWGEMGFLSLDAKSSGESKALDSWNLGGISLLLRVMM